MSQGKSFKSQRHVYVAATETCFLITLLSSLLTLSVKEGQTEAPKQYQSISMRKYL